MGRKEFENGSVLLTGNDMSVALEALINHRGAYEIDCSFCQHEGCDDYCDGCTIADHEHSCSCHINPPCSKCVGSKFEVSPYLINYMHHVQNGRKRWECFKANKATFDKVVAIESSGLHLSAETISTREIAMYIGDDIEKDYEIEVCKRSDFKKVMCEMIEKHQVRFRNGNEIFDKPKTLSDFERYDREHPEIWKHFVEITYQLIRSGKKHYGAKAVFEIIRYHRFVKHGEDLKVNNNYTAYYARKFMKQCPEHAGFFGTRKAKVSL